MFISKLYEMTNGDQIEREYLHWSPDGDCFWVSNIELFSQEVLPRYYKHNNYASFVRQLNSYGFKRSTELGRDPNSGLVIEVFRHVYFRRGRRDLLSEIRRKRPPCRQPRGQASTATTIGGLKAKREGDQLDFMEDPAFENSQEVQHLDPDEEDEVEDLKARCARLEAQVQALLKRDAATTEQLRTHAQTINGLIAYIGSRGLNPHDAFNLAFNTAPMLLNPVAISDSSQSALTASIADMSESVPMQTEFGMHQVTPAPALNHVAPRAEVYHRQEASSRSFLEEPKDGEGVIYSFDGLEALM